MSDSSTEYYNDPKFEGEFGIIYKYKGAWMPKGSFPTQERIDAVMNISFRSTDVHIVSFPKSGTTWLQEIVLQMSCIKDPELLSKITPNGKRAQGDVEKLCPSIDRIETDLVQLEKLPDPRFFKCHLPYQLLPSALQSGVGKIIYIARDVRDVAISYFHNLDFLKSAQYCGTAEDVCNQFLKGKVFYGPWLDHVKGFWTRRDQENVLFLTYEEMKRNPHESVRKVGEFLGVSLTQAQVDDVVESTTFENMKKNDSVNRSWIKESGLADPNKHFIRKGITGDWKNHISQELGDAMDETLLKPLRELGLVFE